MCILTGYVLPVRRQQQQLADTRTNRLPTDCQAGTHLFPLPKCRRHHELAIQLCTVPACCFMFCGALPAPRVPEETPAVTQRRPLVVVGCRLQTCTTSNRGCLRAPGAHWMAPPTRQVRHSRARCAPASAVCVAPSVLLSRPALHGAGQQAGTGFLACLPGVQG
jgi:hypothetical protein